jgi:hypothetical protein
MSTQPQTNDIITVHMDLATYNDICELVRKRDEKRVKMRDRYYQNKAKSNDNFNVRIWNAQIYQPPLVIEIIPESNSS